MKPSNEHIEQPIKQSETVQRKFLSLHEAKLYLSVSKVTLWRWHKTRNLPVSHVGGRAWVRISDLDEIVEKGFKEPKR